MVHPWLRRWRLDGPGTEVEPPVLEEVREAAERRQEVFTVAGGGPEAG